MFSSPHRSRKLIKLAVVTLVAGMAVFAGFRAEAVSTASVRISPEATPTPRRLRKSPARVNKPKYSEFSHDVKAHKMECSKCHTFPTANWDKVRTGDAAFPDVTDYPKHASCINCHRQQFFTGSRPVICSICHTNPGPRNSARHPFPNPREIFDKSPKGQSATSDFEIAFPHDKHIEIVSQNGRNNSYIMNASWVTGRRKMAEESCAVCHKTMNPQGDSDEEYFTKPPSTIGDAFWLKRGTFKSSPTGHTTCFTCHNADSGLSPAPTDCATCHTLRSPGGPADFDPVLASKIGVTERVLLDAWRTRFSSGTFRHEFSSHAELSCATCHSVSAMATNDQKTRKVPVTSCNMCHITATADDGGVLNFEVESRKANPAFQCVKCHISYGSKPIPESHFEAIKAAGN